MNNNVVAIAQQIESNRNKEFLASQVADAFDRVSEQSQYRYDQVLRNMGSIFRKLAGEDSLRIVTAFDIEQYYNQFVSLNPQTECRQLFAHLFPGTPEQLKQTVRTAELEEHASSMRTHMTNDAVRDIQPRDGELPSARTAELEVDEFQSTREAAATPSEAFAPLHSEIDSALLESTLSFDRDIIQRGKKVVASELSSLGVTGFQIYVHDKQASDNGIAYKAAITVDRENADLIVPVEVQGRTPLFPSEFHLGENTYPLTARGLNIAFGKESVEPVRYSADMLDMTYNQLLKDMRIAAQASDKSRAEECLQLIGDKFGADQLRTAFSDYQDILQVKVASEENELQRTASIQQSEQTFSGIRTTRGSAAGVHTPSRTEALAFDEESDKEYGAVISTSQIQLT